jgi:hypothetical protein
MYTSNKTNIEGKEMKRIALACVMLMFCGGLALAQGSPELQQKAATAKEIAAINQQALRAYTWIAKTELSYKGEVKSTLVESCVYGPDGKVQKTVVSAPAPAEKKRGLRGKVVEKKVGEMKEELAAAAALAQAYVPPAADKLQAVIAAGKLSLSQSGPGMVAIQFADYDKSGDSLALVFNQDELALAQLSVDSWLENEKDRVTIDVTFDLLPDGTNHAATTVLDIPGSQIEVRITNSSYQKVSP